MEIKRLKKKPLDFETDTEIDQFALDEQWAEQPELALHYLSAQADAQEKVDLMRIQVTEAKEEAKRVEADIYIHVIDNPEGYNLSKTSNPVVDAVVQNNDDVLAARRTWHEKERELAEAQHELNLIAGATQTITVDKRHGLEHEYKMWESGYFSTPKKKTTKAGKEKTRKSAAEKMKNNASRKGE